MKRDEFQKLPHLLTLAQVVACGYSPATVGKYAAAGILRAVLPKGTTQRRYQKLQVAQLLGWEDAIDRKSWWREKPLLPPCAVSQWTGYAPKTVVEIAEAGSLTTVLPGGVGERKFRKEEIEEWLGL